MHRLDDKLKQLTSRLVELSAKEKETEGAKITAEIKAREETLLSSYVEVSTAFDDLYDILGRMEAVGCIRQVVLWSNSHKFFYWCLKRQLAELLLCREVVAASAGGPRATTFVGSEKILKGWFTEAINSG
ncbi:hypothetical protein DVH05_017112 [Phytophthora capsici]|nr:hypothetical protein DVH05_017112 [Phytophthora capsici]